MNPSISDNNRPTDPGGAKTGKTCFLCQRPGATATQPFGMRGKMGETTVPVCAHGTGCRDGQVRHGPPSFSTHLPGEDCTICTAETARQRRQNAPRTPKPRRSANSAGRHR